MHRVVLTFFLSLVIINIGFSADPPAEGGDYNPSADIMHHIQDANEFHIWKGVYLPLPVIMYDVTEGDFLFTMSNAFKKGKVAVDGYVYDHGRIKLAKNQELSGKISDLEESKAGMTEEQVEEVNKQIAALESQKHTVIDFSITKNVFTMILASILMLVLFISIAKAYKKREGKAPKGVQSFFEPLILFVRDEIAVPNLGHKADRYLPYLLSVFFFIWIVNMMGLIPIFPGSANVTGNIAVTLVLAFFTMMITNLSGNKYYWKHIFAPEVPFWLWPIMVVVELIGVIAKPFALMIRLFANITAGHIIILSLVSLIFVFGKLGQSPGGAAMGAGIAIPFVLFMNLIELLVAFLQAFIFTILSAVFIGLAVEEAHH